MRVFALPNGLRYPSGRPIINCIPLSEGELISSMLSISADEGFVFMTTRQGVVKKVELEQFKHVRSSGIIAIHLDEGDLLEHVFLTNGAHDIMLLANSGKSIRFSEDHVRCTGRSSRGVRGITLEGDQHIVSALAISEKERSALLLTASENGYGKCTAISEYRTQSRGGVGVIAMSTSKRNGPLIGGIVVHTEDQAFMLTHLGRTLRTALSNISVQSRNTQGVRLVRLNENDVLKKLERIDKDLLFLQSDAPLEHIENDDSEEHSTPQ
jgi:DNA gyrase subunit A